MDDLFVDTERENITISALTIFSFVVYQLGIVISKTRYLYTSNSDDFFSFFLLWNAHSRQNSHSIDQMI